MIRRKLRRLIILATLFLPVVLTALLVFQEHLIRIFGVPALRSVIRRELGLELTIGSLRGGIGGELTLADLVARGDAPLTPLEEIEVGRLRASFSTLDAVRGQPGFLKRIEIDTWRLVLDLDRKWPADSEPRSSPSSPPDFGPLPRVRSVNGEAIVRRQGETWRAADIRLEVHEGEYTLEVGSLTTPVGEIQRQVASRPIVVRGSLKLGPDAPTRILASSIRLGLERIANDVSVELSDGDVRVAARIPPLSTDVAARIARHTLTFSVTTRAGRIEDVLDRLPPWEARPSLEGSLETDLEGEVPLEAPERFRLRGTVRLGEARVGDGPRARAILVRLEPAGEGLRTEVEVDALRSPEGRPWSVKAVMTANGPPLTAEHLDLEQLRLTGPTEEFLLSGEFLPGVAGVHGTLSATTEDLSRTLSDWDLLPGADSGLTPAAAAALDGALVATDLEFRGAIEPSRPLEWIRGVILDASALAEVRCPDVLLELEDRERESLGLGQTLGASLQAHTGEDLVRLEALHLDSGSSFLTLEGLADLRDWRLPAGLLELEGQLGDLPVRTVGPVVVDASSEQWTRTPLELDVLGASLRIEAGRRGEGDGILVGIGGERLELDRLPASLMGGKRVSGRVSFDGRIEVPESLVAGDLATGLDGLAVAMEARIRGGRAELAERRIEELSADTAIRWSREGLRIDHLRLLHAADSVTLAGHVGFPIARAPELGNWQSVISALEAELSGEIRVADLAPWVPRLREIRQISGSLSASATLQGRLLRPEIRGTLDLERVSARFPAGMGQVSEVDGRVRLDGFDISIPAPLRLRYNASPVSVSGRVAVAPPWSGERDAIRSVDLQVTGENLTLTPASLSRDMTARGDLDLRISGPWRSMLVQGRVDIRRAAFYTNVRLLPANNPLPFDLFSIPPEKAPLDSLRFAVNLVANRTLRIKNNLVDSEASLELQLRGTGRTPILVGRFFTDNGTVRLPSTTSLQIDNVIIEFLEKQPYNPRIQASLRNRLRGYTVNVVLTGDFEQPELYMDSSPPLPREQVLILVTTGYTLEEINERGVETVAAIQAAKYLGFLLVEYLSSDPSASDSFLSRFSIETESARQIQGDDLIRLEYRITDHVFLQGERDQYGDFNINAGYRMELK